MEAEAANIAVEIAPVRFANTQVVQGGGVERAAVI